MIGFLPLLLRSRFGWIGILVLLAVAVFGGFSGLFGGGQERAHGEARPAAGAKTDEPMVHFVSFVLDDTQSTWRQIFAQHGKQYQNAKLVLFSGATQTSCGGGQSATGPFYCPADQRVYIDLSFYRELSQRLGASGDFAQAYVIAHEIGHHVQRLLGTADRAPQRGAEGSSVRTELQADCYAGIWAHSTDQRKVLEGGDLEEALNAAAAIGDDRLQRQGSGVVRPESFTHGTSAQRTRWFKRGYETGKVESCDTFGTSSL